MGTTQVGTLPARTFWWDRGGPVDAEVYPLRAVIFDLDGALADIERDGHRVAFNAAFAAHGLDIEWSLDGYGPLLAVADERRRIETDLRRRGLGRSADALAEEIHSTKTVLFDELISDADVVPRSGLIDVVIGAFVAGVWVAVVTDGRRNWAEPLVRQLVGEGIVETVVTADDVTNPMPHPEAYELALWELGIPAQNALAVTGSAAGLRTANSVGLATVVVTTGYTADQHFSGAAAVRAGYGGTDPLLIAGCQRLHARWWAAEKRSAA
ncbi:MAG: putative phosphatase/phosphohexomutase [Mycobacterium sp.]|nr:putative phosphatase/phosphohexomutase [Mycobacterium sp.]